MGSIYRRKGSKWWWIKYYRNGRPVRESSRCEKYDDAKDLLKIREGRVAEGKPLGIHFEKITLGELARDLLHHYEANRSREVVRYKQVKKHLLGFFGEDARVVDMSTDRIRAYIVHRQKQDGRNGRKIQNGTISRELDALKRMFALAYENDPPKVMRIPKIPKPPKAPPRTGFFEHDEFLALRERLPEHAKVPVTIAYHTGMRKGEVLKLRWHQVKFDEQNQEGKIILEAVQVKNKTARTIFFNGDMYQVLSKAKKTLDHLHPGCPWVCQINGRRLTDFRRSWKTATKEGGLEGLVFHDFRRTGVRDMVRAGVDQATAMKISGHKTRSVFDRYNIVNEADLKAAASLVKAYHEARQTAVGSI